MIVFTGLPGTGKSTLAEHAAGVLAAPVLGWDWVMASLTPFPELQDSLRAMPGPTYVNVGWSVMWNIGVAQLRAGRSVVFDAVARLEQIERSREIAREHDARFLVVLTVCSNLELHRARVEGRERRIPGWHELDWDHVQSVRARFDPPPADLLLDASNPLEDHFRALDALIA